MQTRRFVLSLAVLFGLCLNLLAAPAHAQTGTTADEGPKLANYGVRCQDGKCMLIVDAGDFDAEVPIPAREPIRFDIPSGDFGFLSGAAVEISDQLTLKLPAGDIKIPTGDFEVGLNTQGQIARLRGSADVMLPNLLLPNDMRIGGAFDAEFGFDRGAALGNLSSLLDPDRSYYFVKLGEGFALDTSMPGDDGKAMPITVTVPENESATIVVDPESQVLYIDGRFNLSQIVKLALVGGMLGIDAGQLPMLSGLALPLRSTVGVSALFSREPERNFVELNTDLGISNGPLANLLQLGDRPLTLDSTIRIERSGLKLQGSADAKLAPETLLESGGTVEVFIPFQRLSDAYVRLGGNLSVPVMGIATSNETQLGGAQASDGVAAADVDLETGVVLSWWDDARGWIGTAASNTATSVASGTQTGVGAVQNAVDAVLAGAGSAAAQSGASGAASSALSGAAGGVTCGVNKAQQLWCQTTGLCEPPEDACAPAEGSGE